MTVRLTLADDTIITIQAVESVRVAAPRVVYLKTYGNHETATRNVQALDVDTFTFGDADD